MWSSTYRIIVIFTFVTSAAIIRTPEALKLPHPFLFFGEDDILSIRKRADSTHAEIASRIQTAAQEIMRHPERYLPPRDWQKFASAWNERYGNDLCAMAFYCLLNDKDLAAREVALQFMERLESLPNWRVAATLRDDVPVAHSLTGMATAFDFLYPVLNNTQRTRFLKKISVVSNELYVRSYDRGLWWGTSYIQNHVATNYMALFTGALVTTRHQNTEAEKWLSRANLMLRRNLELLNLVVDGSLNEGVAYGSYTSRSLTQYVFLALRHFHVDLTHSPWLKEHYWFMHHTVLPGFQETVGFGDSNRNWFYGPESQLVFLDNYVLRNGHGNWLARQIRQRKVTKKPLAQAASHRNSMLHTEFIFYNASIRERALPNPNMPRLAVFSDWGVVTYGGGTGSAPRNNTHSGLVEKRRSFLSFKCGVLHGRAINSIVRTKGFRPWLNGWKNFNPGHEQPDQGSFVFAPGGLPFITETFYGIKYTWLNNAIVFGPSPNSPCFRPYEGQIGECNHWFNFKNMSTWNAEGDVIAASTERDMVFVSGEMSKWYRPALGLLSVYRSLIMLSPTVLLVVDHVERKKGSGTFSMSAFFHNVDHPFRLEGSSQKSTHASVSLEGRRHTVHWSNSQKHVDSMVRAQNYFSDFKGLTTNYLNVTTPLTARIVRASYLFSGPGNDVERPQVVVSNDHGIILSVTINRKRYVVSIATRHNLPYSRYRFLGFGGFGKVQVGENETVRFGVDVITVSSSDGWRANPDAGSTLASWHFLMSITLLVSALVVFFFLYCQLWHKFSSRRLICKVLVSFLGILWVATTVKIHFNLCGGQTCSLTDSRETAWPVHGRRLLLDSAKNPPFLLYTSLPLAGSEILEQLFNNNTDFFNVHITNDSIDYDALTRHVGQKFLNPCSIFYRYRPTKNSVEFIKLLRRIGRDPKTVLPNLPKKSQNALPAVRLIDPGWGIKLPWLRKALEPRMRAVIVVRDPRGWVSSWLREIREDPMVRVAISKVFNALKHHKCLQQNTSYFVPEYRIMQKALAENPDANHENYVLPLSYLWATHVNSVVHVNSKIPNDRIHFVSMEDLILRPRKTAQKLFRFLGLPLPPAAENRILHVVRTGSFSLGASREVVTPKTITNWERELGPEQANQVKEICAAAMLKLRYDV